MSAKVYDLIILVDAGIGNAIQALPSIEYLRKLEVKAGIYMGEINASFQQFISKSYPTTVLEDLGAVKCHHLIHLFTYQKAQLPEHENYLYINPDYHSSKHASETELILSAIVALYPKGDHSEVLNELQEANPYDKLSCFNIEEKYILYPGGSAVNSARRWPYFKELRDQLGTKNSFIVGGMDDVNFSMSFVYPRWLSIILPQALLNRKSIWKMFKGIGILKKHAHWYNLHDEENAAIERFSWEELVYLFRRAKGFVGNDGGLLHLAAACGLKGVALFGPTSEKKNKPFYKGIQILTEDIPCRPCQFGAGGVQMTTGFINCPFEVACLKNIEPSVVIKQMEHE